MGMDQRELELVESLIDMCEQHLIRSGEDYRLHPGGLSANESAICLLNEMGLAYEVMNESKTCTYYKINYKELERLKTENTLND